MNDNRQPQDDSSTPRTLIGELLRRRVLQVGAAYFVVAWLVVQVASEVADAFDAPGWVMQAVLFASVAGFPVSLALSWIFDITPTGIHRTSTEDARRQRAGSKRRRKRALLKEPVSDRRRLSALVVKVIWSSRKNPDPEVLRAALPELEKICSSVASRYEGHLTKVAADRLVIYFGFPVVHENDAQRAARSGLAILEGTEKLRERLQSARGMGISVRAGIDTGTVVVEHSGDPDDSVQVLGDVVANAEWLQTLGEENTLIAGESTSQLIEGYFYQELLGSYEQRPGLGETSAFRVVNESAARSRLETGRRLAPYVGRELELGILQQRWSHVRSGHGHIVLITGNAGIGKSRLVYELKREVAKDLKAWLTELVCSPDYVNRALHPVIDFFRRHVLEEADTDVPAEAIAKIEGLLAQAGFDLRSTVPLLADLLGVPCTEEYTLQLGPKLQREKTLDLLIQLILFRARAQPLLLVVEDLHWADPSTLELIGRIVPYAESTGLLIVLTSRPELDARLQEDEADSEDRDKPNWIASSHVLRMPLTPLTSEDTHTLLASIADKRVDPQIFERIFEVAEGNPLYTEELARNVFDSLRPGEPLSSNGEFEMPMTIQDILLARLDGLPPEARACARLCSVLGRDFSYDLAAKFSVTEGIADFDHALDVLIEDEIVSRRGIAPGSSYSFRHVLFQVAAYDSILKTDLETYHRRVVRLLQKDFATIVAQQPEVIARHLLAGSNVWEALPYLKLAGDAALRRSAEEESRRYLQTALDELRKLPESGERDELELQLQISLGPALMAVAGYSAPEVFAAYSRAEALSANVESSPRMAPVLAGLWTYHVVSGRLPAALDYAEKLLDIAERTQNEDLLLESHLTLGVTLTHSGPVTEARDHLTRVDEMYVQDRHARHAYVYGQDPKMSALAYLGATFWWLGLTALAHESSQASIGHARELGHKYSLAFALAASARTYLKLGYYSECIKAANEASEIAERHGFPVWRTMADFLRSAAEYRLSGRQTAIPLMERHLESCIKVGNTLSTAYYRSVIAEAHIVSDRLVEAGHHLQDAYRVLELHVRDSDEAEIERVQGLLLWRQEDMGGTNSGAAEARLRRAHDLALGEGALSWQVRTGVTLARFLLSRSKVQEARTVVSGVLDSTSNGSSSPFITEARGLYEELSER